MTISNFAFLKVIGRAAAVGTVALLIACSQSSPDKLLASAKDYLAKGDRPAAIIQLKNALQSAPDNGEARFLLGKASLETRDFPSAEKELRRALELNQPADEVLPLLAQAMIEAGQHEALIKDFGTRRLSQPGAQATFQTLLGDAYLRLNDREAAAKAYELALEAQNNFALAQLGQVTLVALDGKIDEGLAQVDRIIVTSPKLARAYGLKSDLLLGKGDRPGARKALETAIEIDTYSLPARVSLLSLLIEERDFDSADALLDSTRKVAPSDLRVTYLDAALAFRKADKKRAREQVQEVLRYAPDYVPSIVLSAALDLQDGQFEAAEAGLLKALAQSPNHLGARRLLVQAYLRMGQPVKAKDALQPLLDQGSTEDAQLQLLAGETYLATGDALRAAVFYQAAAKGQTAERVAARTRLGQIALVTGRSDEGIAELEAASELDAGAYQADLSLIASHLRRNETDKAMQAVRALEKKQPKNPLTFQMYGVVNLAKRDFDAARTSFDKALEIQPTYLPSAYNLAQLDILQKKPEDARKRYEAMIAKEPKNEQLFLALAELQTRTDAAPDDIAATLQRGVKANPQAPAARVALVNFLLRTGETKAALTAAEESLAAMPSDPRVLDVAGVTQEAAGEINRAIGTYNKLASLQPHAPQPLYRLAALYVRQNDIDKAIESLRRIPKIAPGERDVVPHLVRAYVAAGRYDEAFKEARGLQKREPKFVGGWSLEGDIYLSQRKFAESERLYRAALKLEPKANAVAIKLHGALSSAGRNGEADAFAKKWIAENPKDTAMRIYLGDRELVARNLKAAAVHYEAVIAIDQNNALALNNLAWVGGELGDPKALGYAERAVKLVPNNALVLDTYGMLLVKKGEADKGLPFLERASKIAPGRNDLRLNYAKGLIMAGKKEAARKELEVLQAVKEDFAGKEEVAGLLKGL